jgi:putative copper resistance protein D
VVIAKAVTYAATLGAAGGVAFLVYGDDVIPPDCRVQMRGQLGVLLVVAVLASGAKILAMAASMAGDASGLFDPALAGMVLASGEGSAVLARACGLAILGTVVMACRQRSLIALVGALLTATSFAWVGHVHTLGRSWLWTAVLAVHLMGVAFWVGALAPLLLVAQRADNSVTAALASRFGRTALVMVAILVAAGVTLLCVLLQDATELRSSDYGRLALCKLAFAALLLGLAALNRLRLTPRMLAGDATAVLSFGRSLKAEMVLALLILSVTAAMTTLTGPGVD